MNLYKFLLKIVNKAFISANIHKDHKVQISPSINSKFGDYQINGVMEIAKKMNISSFDLAKKISILIPKKNIFKKIEVIKPGFINLFLQKEWVESQISNYLTDYKFNFSKVTPQNIVVDYSSPNVAKEMHVGHLRSTIIGDSIVRTLEFLGHNVIRANHIGDWGTQFGMLIAYLAKKKINLKHIRLSTLDKCYREAQKLYDNDHEFSENARNFVFKLQNKDNYYINIWRSLVDITMRHNNKIYQKLGITLTTKDIMGESTYNDMLPTIVEDLKLKGLAVENNGAIVVFLEEFKNKQGKPMGVIIKKKDGAYLYITTDIACAKYRYEILKADRIIYYIDSRQNQYFMNVYTIVRKAGYVPYNVPMEHHMFGMICDKNGKPFKTRTGNNIRLSYFLNEAIKRTYTLISKKNPLLNEKELKKISYILSIGSIKYADLSKNRTTDYIFDWNKIISFEGNTVLYIQYTYTRIVSLLKNSHTKIQSTGINIIISTETEHLLAVHLLKFEEIIFMVARDGMPHILCTYLYKLSVLFSSFYENCRIIGISNTDICNSRLQLSIITSTILKKGLNLLGINTLDRI